MPFKKGNKIRGSRKGIPNRVTKEFKENVENLFQDMGGYARALDWFSRHPEAFYLKVLAQW